MKTLNKLHTSKKMSQTGSAPGCKTRLSTAKDKPTAAAGMTFHFIREPIKKKKVSEQYKFYCLNYTLILKTVPKKTFY